MITDEYLTDEQSKLKALGLIKSLQGIPIDQAIGVLKDAETMIKAVHEVNVPNERFNYFLKHYESFEE